MSSTINNYGPVGIQNINLQEVTNEINVAQSSVGIVPSIKEQLIDRDYLLDEIQQAFDDGSSIVVLYGNQGVGKTTIAERFCNKSYGLYDQTINTQYRSTLADVFCRSFGKEISVNDDKINQVRNLQVAEACFTKMSSHAKTEGDQFKRLFIIDNVTDWEDIGRNIKFLQARQTHYLLTAETLLDDVVYKGYELQVANIMVAPPTDAELLHFFQKHLDNALTGIRLKRLKSSWIVARLYACHCRNKSAKWVADFTERLLSEELSELDLLVRIMQVDAESGRLEDAHLWLLLQIACMPDKAMDVEDLALDLKAIYEDEFDLSTSEGFKIFREHYSFSDSDKRRDIDHVVTDITDLGWLDTTEDEFQMHGLTRKTLLQYFQDCDGNSVIPGGIFSEYASKLSLSYFDSHYDEFDAQSEDGEREHNSTKWHFISDTIA